jgi:glucokinase
LNLKPDRKLDSHCILAVDAGGTFLKAALVLADGRLAEGSAYRIAVDSNGPLETIRQSYIDLAARGRELAEQGGLILDGIGVCIPGPFQYQEGYCLMTHKYQAIYKVPMRPWFEAGAGTMPVRFVHDSTAYLLGETWGEQYAAYQRIGCVLIGTGLGFASWLDGRIFSNPQGGPGISIYTRPYRDGTAEDYVSRRGIINRYRASFPDSKLDVREIDILARDGQPEAIAVFRDTGILLAEILHDILRDHGFEVLLLGGQISKGSDLFLNELKAGLADLPALKLIRQVVRMDDAPLLGVARACWYP